MTVQADQESFFSFQAGKVQILGLKVCPASAGSGVA
jgi:hypothetical protein